MLRRTLLTLLGLLPLLTQAQSGPSEQVKKDSLLYVGFMSKADSLYRINEKKEAKHWVKQAMNAGKRSGIGHIAVRAATKLASYESYEGNFFRTYAILDSLEALIAKGRYDDYAQAIIYDNQAIHVRERGDLGLSLSYSAKVADAMDRAGRLNARVKGILMGNDADNYYKLGLYKKALFLALESREILLRSEEEGSLSYPDFSLCISNNNISEVYTALGDTSKAIEFGLLGRQRYDQMGYEVLELKQRNLQVLYRAYLKAGRKEEALRLILDRYRTIQTDDRKNIRERLKAILDLADYYQQNKEETLANTYFSQAEMTMDSISGDKRSLFFAYAPIIQSHLERGNLDRVSAYLDESLEGVNMTNIYKPEVVVSRDPNFFVQLLAYKGEYHHQRYREQSKAADLSACLDWYKAAFEYISYASQRLGSTLNPKASAELENITSDFLLVLEEHQAAISKTEDVYGLMANTLDFIKSFNLKNNLNRLNNQTIAGIPENLLEREEELKNRINILGFKIKKEQANEEDVKLLNASLASLNSLSMQFKKDYPRYASLNYYEVFDGAKDYSEKAELSISYYFDQQHLFALVLGKGRNKFHKIKIPSQFESLIEDHISALRNVKNGRTAEQGQEELRSLLLDPLVLEGYEKLSIIPYKTLNKLPFESLLKPEDLQRTSISYDYSLFMNQGLKTKSKDRFAVFAPVFADSEEALAVNSRRAYSELIYSLQEAEEIGKVFEVDFYLKEEATADAFRTQLDAEFLHLATHVEMDKEEPLNTRIIFSPASEAKAYMTLGEIYNAKIPSEMVVLSACDTGVGKEENGYGVKSLANGFFFAGAKSVVMSLWRVDDYSTSIIMKNYYQNLKKGQSKDDALKNAKLQYLDQVEDEQLKHPYYWAGFVVSGDMSPLKERDYWIWILAGVGLLGALLLFRKKLLKHFQ